MTQPPSRLLVAINDLRVYGAAIAQPTGMQRVAAGLAAALVKEHGAIPITIDARGARRTALPTAAPGRAASLAAPLLAALSRAPRSAQEQVRRVARTVLAGAARRGGAAEPMYRGDWIAVLGAPWIAPGTADAVIAAKRRDSARIALLVHDLLPTTAQQWFADAQGRAAQRDVEQLIAAADALFAVSPAVAAEIRARYGRSATPLLPADLPLIGTTTPSANATGERIVLAVGTLHPRKNFAALVRIWEAWAARGAGSAAATASGASAVPPLVIAGRRHPQDGDLFAALSAATHARKAIILVHDASDAQLADLYGRARFVVLPSLAEGWGLPVREAFAAGRPVITTDAVPAALGSPFAAIVPANDASTLAQTIEAWWSSDVPEKLSARLATEFHPRTWSSVARELANALRDERAG